MDEIGALMSWLEREIDMLDTTILEGGGGVENYLVNLARRRELIRVVEKARQIVKEEQGSDI